MQNNHKQCSCSTGFHEHPLADGSPEKPWGLTYGSGELDDFGYWEHPCNICARNAEKRDNVPKNSYWPFENNNNYHLGES